MTTCSLVAWSPCGRIQWQNQWVRCNYSYLSSTPSLHTICGENVIAIQYNFQTHRAIAFTRSAVDWLVSIVCTTQFETLEIHCSTCAHCSDAPVRICWIRNDKAYGLNIRILILMREWVCGMRFGRCRPDGARSVWARQFRLKHVSFDWLLTRTIRWHCT